MVRSMTGYGRNKMIFDNMEILVELRSVNHRNFECSVRVPRNSTFLEEPLKKLISANVARGKVDVNVFVTWPQGGDEELVVQMDKARETVAALRAAGEELNLTDDLTVRDLLFVKDLFHSLPKELDVEDLTAKTLETATGAIQAFCQMREVEGQKLYDDIMGRLDFLEKMANEVDELSAQTVNRYKERLIAKISEVVADRNIEESRVLTEAAIFADKIATDEETVRLRSHVAQFRQLLGGEEPCGKKLEFLVQECNREVNTTGSKCNDLAITNLVLEAKSQIEKIREQLANVE